ncbi:MAG: RT0821/Lpp0805 family surface protein [Rhizobiaceae bacterium]|nr:RT0821/Lpp0805 family surface protein [Rhizobiaceae bacterium]
MHTNNFNIPGSMMILLVALVSTSGCMGGMGLDVTGGPDTSLYSGSIPVSGEDATDRFVIRDTVAQAQLGSGFVQEIPWFNSENGNSGTVSFIREESSVGKVCRDFIVSKHSYDGIAQYTGEICRTRMTKSWTLNALDLQS